MARRVEGIYFREGELPRVHAILTQKFEMELRELQIKRGGIDNELVIEFMNTLTKPSIKILRYILDGSVKYELPNPTFDESYDLSGVEKKSGGTSSYW